MDNQDQSDIAFYLENEYGINSKECDDDIIINKP